MIVKMIKFFSIIPLVLFPKKSTAQNTQNQTNQTTTQTPHSTSQNNTIVRDSIISFVVYLLMLGIIYLKIPSLWTSWTTPIIFFVLTNLALIGGILLHSVVKKPILGWIIIIVVTLFILINWISCILDLKPKTETSENNKNTTYYQEKKNRVVDSVEVFRGTTPCDISPCFTKDSTYLYSSGPITISYEGVRKMENIYYSGRGKLDNLPERRSRRITAKSTSSTQREIVAKRIRISYE